MATITTVEEVATSQVVGTLLTELSSEMEQATPILDWPNTIGFQTLHEERTPIELTVTGKIPAYARGELFRTGPASYKVPLDDDDEFVFDHWFDGLGHTHRFEIITDEDTTKVFYNSRRADDGLVELIREGRMKTVTFAQKRDPCIGLYGKVMSVFKPPPQTPSERTVNVTLRPNMPGLPASRKVPTEPVGHSTSLRSLWAGSDSKHLKELDPQTLEPIGLITQATLNPSLKGDMSCAHSMSDPETGDIFNFNLNFGRNCTYRLFKTSAETGKTDILATIEGNGIKPAYLHSFFMSQDYVILCIWGSHFSHYGLRVVQEQNLVDAMAPYDPSQSARWLVVDRRGGLGLVAEYESPNFFSFHTVNAWQETNLDGTMDIICECVAYENMDIIHKLYYKNISSDSKDAMTFNKNKMNGILPHLSRYRLPKITAKTLKRSSRCPKITPTDSVAKSLVGDLPTFNPAYQFKANRYIYGVVNRGLSSFLDGISKVDTQTKEVIYWDNAKGHTPGEAIFVANPEGTQEDDGVLLSVVLDGIKESSYLLCLDATTLKEVGRAEVSCVVGFGFHGVHVQS